MLALTYDDRPRLTADRPSPKPGKQEVLVAVRMAGICRTDLEILKGYMGFRGVMGHEFVGTVVKGPPRWQGRRVTAEINCVCGQCDLCKAGLSSHCRRRTVLGIDGRDGAFAEYVAVPEANLHEVPDSVSDIEAVFIEPLAAAFQVVRQVEIARGAEVVVLGDGRLGQLVASAIKAHQARQGRGLSGRVEASLLLVGRHACKLEAAEKQGVRTCLLEAFAPRREADIVVDATGTAGGFALAMRTVRPRGTIVLKSTFAGGGELDLAPLVVDEITVVGSRCGPFADAIAALAAPEGAAGRVDVSAMVSSRFPLADGLAALEAAAQPENIKVVLDVAR